MLASRWMLSRTRAPGLSSVPPRPRQPRPPAPRSANPARTCPPRTAGGNVTDDDSDRVLCHLTAALVDLSRSRPDGPATRHLRSVGSAHPGRARRRRLSPGGRRRPRRIVCGVAERRPRPARASQQARPSRPRRTPHAAQRQRRQQVDRLRLGDRHERGRVRTGRVRRVDCRRSPRATRAFLRIPAPIPRPTVAGPFDPTSAIAGATRDQAAPVVDGVDREQQQRQVHAVRDASAAGQPAAIGSRHPVTAPATSVRPVAAVGQTAARHRRGPASASRARCAMPRTTTDDRVPGSRTGPLTSPDGTAHPHRNGCRPAAITVNTDQH